MLENYTLRKNRWLKDLDRSLARVKPFLMRMLGEEQARIFVNNSLQEYEAVIPRIPFIGKNNPLLVFFKPAPQYLSVYRALLRQNRTVEEVGDLIYEIGAAELQAIPSIARQLSRLVWFSRVFRDRLRKRAITSHRRKYPGDFVLTYVEGDGIEFDYGVDYIECANCKLLEAEDAMEIAPYICAVDNIASDLLGWGLIRTMTLAEGSHKCDFRFKKGGETRVILPHSLQSHRAPGFD